MSMCDEVLNTLKAFNLPITWHSFVKIPPEHAFVTYDTPSVNFEGGDNFACFKYVNMTVRFFFKDVKTNNDFEIEKQFEDNVRFMGKFTKSSGYDSGNGLFYSTYTFDFGETY